MDDWTFRCGNMKLEVGDSIQEIVITTMNNTYRVSSNLVFLIVATPKSKLCLMFTKDFNPFDITSKYERLLNEGRINR